MEKIKEDEVSFLKDIYAELGVTMHIAQNIEKRVLLLSIDASKITQSRFDEIFLEKSLLTFGQLKRDIESSNLFNKEELEEVERFNSARNEVIHHFWWSRTSKLKNEDSRLYILSELSAIRISFEKLEETLSEKQKNILVSLGMSPADLTGELVGENDILPSANTSRKLSKSETILDIFRYRTVHNGSIPIFLLKDNTYWSICEAGLTIYKVEIDSSKIEKIELFKDLFPIHEFNPKPSKKSNWHYDLLLKKKNFQISIRPTQNRDPYSFIWDINQNSTKPQS